MNLWRQHLQRRRTAELGRTWAAEALRRTWAAEDDARQMTNRATLAEAHAVYLTKRLRELTREIAILRQHPFLTTAGTDPGRLCPDCHDPMPFGIAHYCGRNSTYREETAA